MNVPVILRRRRFQYGGAFSPLSLFASGEEGAWYEPSTTTCFTATWTGSAFTDIAAAGYGDLVAIMEDQSGNGNDATQTDSSKRPILARVPSGGRRNLLERTEEFDNAYWTKDGASVTANQATHPTYGSGADLLTETSGGTNHRIYSAVISDTGARTFSVSVKNASGSRFVGLRLQIDGTNNYGWAVFDLSGETVDTNAAVDSASITPETDGWYRLEIACTLSAASVALVAILNTGTAPATSSTGISYTGDGTSGIYLTAAQDEAASSATAYQRVSSQYDITEAGVTSLEYLAFDGSDDGMATASIDFTATDKMSVFAGVLSNTAPGTNVSNILAELSASSGANNGSFGIFAPIDNGGFEREEYGALLRGSLNDIAAYNETISEAHVTSALFDIGAATNASQIVFRSDGSAVAPTLSATDAGTGNFGNYPFNIGARNNAASAWFDGKLFSLIVRGAASTAGEISDTESYVADKTGVTL